MCVCAFLLLLCLYVCVFCVCVSMFRMHHELCLNLYVVCGILRLIGGDIVLECRNIYLSLSLSKLFCLMIIFIVFINK